MVMKSCEYRSVSPVDFRLELQRANTMFEGDKQHDAQEALNTILDCLVEENKQKDGNKISEIFDGEMKEVITCSKCAKISKPIDLFRFLHVDVPKKNLRLTNA